MTVLEHVIIAMICTGIGFLCGDLYAGAAFGSALFIGREHTQAEYRWIQTYGQNKRDNMKWYGGFLPVVWDLGSLMDWLVPALTVSIIGVIYYFIM